MGLQRKTTRRIFVFAILGLFCCNTLYLSAFTSRDECEINRLKDMRQSQEVLNGCCMLGCWSFPFLGNYVAGDFNNSNMLGSFLAPHCDDIPWTEESKKRFDDFQVKAAEWNACDTGNKNYIQICGYTAGAIGFVGSLIGFSYDNSSNARYVDGYYAILITGLCGWVGYLIGNYTKKDCGKSPYNYKPTSVTETAN